MKLGEVLRLIGAAFLFSTLIYGATALECESGGMCYLQNEHTKELEFVTKNCSDSCVYFKCYVGDYKIMEGAGCFEDFVNTCKFIDFQLLKEIQSNYQNYSYDYKSLVLASCNERDGCAKEMFYKMVPFEHRIYINKFFNRPQYAERDIQISREYDNSPKKKLSKVICETKGWCKTGGRFSYDDLCSEVGPPSYRLEPSNVTKICDSCSKFLCTLNGKEIISGHGCFEDFEQICGNVIFNDTIKNEISENRKNYFYFDENIIMVTCSDSDNCQFDAFKNYYDINIGERNYPLLQLKHYGTCDYEPIVIPPTTTESTTTIQTSSTSSIPPTTTTESTKTIQTSSSTSSTTATTKFVSFESTSQQNEKENINNLSVKIQSSFKLMFLIVLIIILFVLF